jgi:hypothetical protein
MQYELAAGGGGKTEMGEKRSSLFTVSLHSHEISRLTDCIHFKKENKNSVASKV